MKAHVTLGSFILSVLLVSSCAKEGNHYIPAYILAGYKTVFDSSTEYYHFYDRDISYKLLAERDSTKSTQLAMNVAYDNSGKAIKALFSQDGGPVTYTYEFEYAGSKVSKRQRRSGSLQVSEDYNTYAYDDLGHLIADSQFSKGSGTSYQLAWVSKFTYEGNNITEGVSYQVINGTPQIYARVKNEYDDKVNPFRNLANEYYYNEAGNAIYAITINSSNNVVKQYTATGNADYQLFLTSSYQYNANGYAWKVRTVNLLQPHQNSDVEYYY